jgi:hypothetical protein
MLAGKNHITIAVGIELLRQNEATGSAFGPTLLTVQ